MEDIALKGWLKKVKLNESAISMILGVLVVIVVGVLLINYFRGIRQPAQEAEKQEVALEVKESEESTSLPMIYTIKKGDNLWNIAKKFYGSGYKWTEIAKENNLVNPNLILADQKLNLPKIEAEKTQVAEPITGDKYTVVKGDNLWNIAVRAYGDGFQWVKIARENKLVNPSLIHSGNVFTLPR